ncbi:hypothetical protein GT360_08025 [Vibrio astriarenae]|uniref:GH26 domain-containing protein n=1 Tax=Vibrio astriarenae TaxID=1481923 RepID=A0A7Z2YDM6_9VIBR|nr:glycosyl hydrolase [Vibrio astriarenae]QIA63467.1 hypothetical protein GT360_08025 [Vibrio astriarenae]
MKHYLIALLSCSLLSACSTTVSESLQRVSDPDIPTNIRLFVGQDLGSVGGLEEYNQGYVDYFGVPAGVTIYTSLESLEGLTSKVNYGAGDSHADLYLTSSSFDDVDIAMGLNLVNQLDKVNSGQLDQNLAALSDWIKRSNRKVYLRIGYEYEGAWNGYEPEAYKQAYRHIVSTLEKAQTSNVEYVWQSSGYEEDRDNLLRYYPGDGYVDWMSYSYFNHDPKEAGKETLQLAREKNKPVMIAEVTPRGADLLLDDGEELWKTWFVPFLAHIKDNQDSIKIVAYINALWDEQPMWEGQGWGDSRLQANLYLATKWRRTLKREGWEVKTTVAPPPIFILPDDYEERKQARNKNQEALIPDEKQSQAEDAIPKGNARIYPDSAAVGGQGIAYIYQEGDGLLFKEVTQSNYLIVRYASERSGTIGLAVNGIRKYDLQFESTGSWVGNYNTIELMVDIPNKSDVEIIWNDGDSALNIDYLVFDRR